ncbi:hypothetical protein BDV26DRAFT_69755 [Aspergillus bertholletiae]|uniref:Uncharacterized protein n=1 Tax=Aspergillus bertholletiae TaxID=1226010 RepID=A0A5N7AU13_9EURO|nr:hypothetical protein BDV26DRAFT_69755 [Aspergillus bertholletiae]
MCYTLYYSGSFVLSALSVAILTVLSYTSLVCVNLTEYPIRSIQHHVLFLRSYRFLLFFSFFSFPQASLILVLKHFVL